MAIDLGMSAETMNIAIVVAGGMADVFDRVRAMMLGNLFNIGGSTLITTAVGDFSTEMVIFGRVLQGLAAACIMFASLALVKTYWVGRGRANAPCQSGP